MVEDDRPSGMHPLILVVITDADDASALAGSLTGWLSAVSFRDRTVDQVTELLIEAIIGWGEAAGWRVYRGARSVVELPQTGRHSTVDVGIARPGAAPIVVEVDRSDRRRTIDKLIAETAAGRVAVWVRWGTGPFQPPTPPIQLVTCPVVVRRGVRGQHLFSFPSTQLAPPPHSGIDLSQSQQAGLFG
jgi:hypothetical protein